jgi:hypothetical protein
MAIGRISGQLLKDDLQRDGKNLAFDTDLIYLDVVGRNVGINKTNPSQPLDVDGTIKSTNLVVSTSGTIANINFATNTITSTDDTLNLVPNASNAVVVQAKLQVDNLELTGSNINALGTDKSINLRPTGTGKVNVYSDMLINGNLTVTGTVTADAGSSGTIAIGDSSNDNVVFNADINSNIRPNANETFSLGEAGQRWLDTYTKNLYATTLNATNITLTNGINLTLTPGKTYFVATNGGDTKSGTHQNDPFASVVKALSVATSGDTIYIYPGTYTEVFPMTVPVGVTVRGAGIRSVLIQPTSGTRDKDAFLLNGETTVEDLTVGYFEYNAGANTGHAFRYATNFRVTTRSPYVRNISVITQGSTVRLGTNPADDPRGFLAGDAGRGGFFDGSIANSASKDVSMLFHAVTFITPGINCITSTNGVRIEWLNSFIYFALRGFNLTTGTTGQFGTAQTALKIPAAIRVGTWAVSNTVTYYDTDKTTVLATGVIAAISGDWVYLTGRCLGFETLTDRVTKTITVHGDAKISNAQAKFNTTSLALDGIGDYISVPTQPDFEFGTGTWCLEAWVYRTTDSGTSQILFDFRTTVSEAVPTLFLSATYVPGYLVSGSQVITGAAAIPLNTWTHIAVSKDGTNNTRLFVNGTQSGSTYTDTTTYIQGPAVVGARFDGTLGFYGYIDDVRISKGVARYTTNFTAPTTAFVGDSDTVLLLHFTGANNSTIIVDDGVTKQDLRTSALGTANLISYADYTKFGTEVRSIGSANVYGTYGFVGDGPGVIAYLVSQNFAYVGAGRFSTNDPTEQIAANEVVKTNGAKIYYSSIDNQGDFRVGDYFNINQKDGTVTFSGESFNIPSLTSIVFTDGLDTTTIDATKVETGNINISGNTITTLNGGLILSSASGVITINSTKSFVIPVGNLSQRPSPATAGAVRFNNESGYNWFEGYNGSNWIPLGQVTDLAQTTYIKAEATPGAGDKTLYFYANGTLAATLTDTAFTTDQIDVGNIEITSNTMSSITPSTDINVQPASAVFTASITPGTDVTFSGSISGTTLTVVAAPSGLGLAVGQVLVGPGIQYNTYITANLTGTGTSSSSTWTVSESQSQMTAVFEGDITGTTLTVTAIVSGELEIGQIISGSGVTPGTFISANITENILGSTWTVSASQSVPSGTTFTSTTTRITATPVVMNVSSMASGTIAVGYTLSATGYMAGTVVTAFSSGSGTTGTYLVSPNQTYGSRTVTAYNNNGVVVSNIKISSNRITNTITDAVTVLKTNGEGYVRIAGTNGVVIPSGGSSVRPAFPTIGMIRFNTDIGSTELYNGSIWGGLSGESGAINLTQAQDIAIQQVLTFG